MVNKLKKQKKKIVLFFQRKNARSKSPEDFC